MKFSFKKRINFFVRKQLTFKLAHILAAKAKLFHWGVYKTFLLTDTQKYKLKFYTTSERKKNNLIQPTKTLNGFQNFIDLYAEPKVYFRQHFYKIVDFRSFENFFFFFDVKTNYFLLLLSISFSLFIKYFWIFFFLFFLGLSFYYLIGGLTFFGLLSLGCGEVTLNLLEKTGNFFFFDEYKMYLYLNLISWLQNFLLTDIYANLWLRLAPSLQLIFQEWEEHAYTLDFFYKIHLIDFYWLTFFILTFYTILLSNLGNFFYLSYYNRKDFWPAALNLFYGDSHNSKLSSFVDKISPIFGQKTITLVGQNKKLAKTSVFNRNTRLAEYNYFLSQGFGGYVGFIDFFPSYTNFFDYNGFKQNRLFLKNPASFMFDFFGKFREQVIFSPFISKKFKNNYFQTNTKNQTHGSIRRNLTSVPRFKLLNYNNFWCQFLVSIFGVVSLFGDLKILRLREKIFFNLFEKTKNNLVDENFVDFLDKSQINLTVGSGVDLYQRKLNTIVLGRTLNAKLNPVSYKIFNFGVQNLFNDHSFWLTDKNYYGIFRYSYDGQEISSEDYSEKSIIPGQRSDLYDESVLNDVVDNERLDEQERVDLDESLFFEDNFLHDDVESVVFGEELDEEDFDSIVEYGLSKRDKFVPEDEELRRFLSNPLLISGAGQEEDYAENTVSTNNPFIGLEYGSDLAFKADAGSTAYDDLIDIYWVNSGSIFFKNFFEYPTLRFFNSYSKLRGHSRNVKFRRLTGGRFWSYFLPYWGDFIFPKFNLLWIEALLSIISGFILIVTLVILHFSFFLYYFDLVFLSFYYYYWLFLFLSIVVILGFYLWSGLVYFNEFKFKLLQKAIFFFLNFGVACIIVYFLTQIIQKTSLKPIQVNPSICFEPMNRRLPIHNYKTFNRTIVSRVFLTRNFGNSFWISREISLILRKSRKFTLYYDENPVFFSNKITKNLNPIPGSINTKLHLYLKNIPFFYQKTNYIYTLLDTGDFIKNRFNFENFYKQINLTLNENSVVLFELFSRTRAINEFFFTENTRIFRKEKLIYSSSLSRFSIKRAKSRIFTVLNSLKKSNKNLALLYYANTEEKIFNVLNAQYNPYENWLSETTQTNFVSSVQKLDAKALTEFTSEVEFQTFRNNSFNFYSFNLFGGHVLLDNGRIYSNFLRSSFMNFFLTSTYAKRFIKKSNSILPETLYFNYETTLFPQNKKS